MLVRDIVERPASKPTEPGSAPEPPRPPVASRGGFPIAAHRSKGMSAFARARKDDAARRAGGLPAGQGRVVENVPTVGSTSGETSAAGASAAPPATEEEKIRRQVEDENRARVAAMSPAEREQEAEELKERFGPGLADLMRKRRDARTSQQAQASAGPSTAPSTSTATAPTTAPTAPSASEDAKILASADKENRVKVAGMSLEEHAQEMNELEDLFGRGLLGKIKARAQAKAAGRPPPVFEPEPPSELTPMDTDPAPEPQPPIQTASSARPAEPTTTVEKASKGKRNVRFSEEDAPTPAALKRYFPTGTESEASKLEWMSEDVPMKPASDEGPRFDLAGVPLSAAEAAKLPTHLGLHHHGASPDSAGYTLSEIVHLCYSTVPSQRITMIGVLTKLIRRYRAALEDGEKSQWVTFCKDEDVLAKGTDVAVGVLGGHARSVGVFVAAVELLYTTLGGPWPWMDASTNDGEDIVPFHPEPSRDGEPTGVAAVPWEDLVQQLQVTLSLEPGAYPPSTLSQLLQILRRAALAQPQGAEAIAPLIPAVVRTHVLGAPWPLEPSQPPNAEALAVLYDATTSSRSAAEALVGQNVYAPLLKFGTVADFDEPAVQSLLTTVMRTFYQLGRYGLAANTATSASEIWRAIGNWVAQSVNKETTPQAQEVVQAYFDLLGVWTVCAVDPHRTTPEHDLTWAQASALQWLDEELSAAAALQKSSRWGELASVLGAVAEWLSGSVVNEPKHGEDVNSRVLSAFENMDLVGNLPQSVTDMPQEGRDAFNSALTQVFRLHSLLGGLLRSPERERLIYWLAATTQASPSDVHLRHEVLKVARADGVLSLKEWASSAFDLALSYLPGDEPLALSLVDDILNSDWSAGGEGSGVAQAVKSIGHKDGLVILRPLLHHAVLPSLDQILGPSTPDYHYLKPTTTLRPPPASMTGPSVAGLPLAPDWVFAPLNELLASGSSDAFALAPKDWDAGETQITRATLALALIDTEARGGRNASEIVLNAMKVFMLEHGQQEAPNTEHDVFRDDAVARDLKDLLDTTCVPASDIPATPGLSVPSTSSSSSATAASTERSAADAGPRGDAPADDAQMDTDPTSSELTGQSEETKTKKTEKAKEQEGPLEKAALSFLTRGVPFFQFYTDLLALYSAASFGDASFGRVLLPPLSMLYAADYRRLFWAESDALRSVRLRSTAVPAETGSLGVFFSPLETEKDILTAYARALVTVLRDRTDEFLPQVAMHHLAGLWWTTTDEERTGIRIQLMVVMLASATDAVLRRIIGWDLQCPLAGVSVGEEVISRRVKEMARLTGPRGVARLKAAGYDV